LELLDRLRLRLELLLRRLCRCLRQGNLVERLALKTGLRLGGHYRTLLSTAYRAEQAAFFKLGTTLQTEHKKPPSIVSNGADDSTTNEPNPVAQPERKRAAAPSCAPAL